MNTYIDHCISTSVLRFSLCYLKMAKHWHPLIYLRVFTMAICSYLQNGPTKYFNINQNLCLMVTNKIVHRSRFWQMPDGCKLKYPGVWVIVYSYQSNKEQNNFKLLFCFYTITSFINFFLLQYVNNLNHYLRLSRQLQPLLKATTMTWI